MRYSLASLALVALAASGDDTVAVGWAPPDDPLTWTEVRQVRGPCPAGPVAVQTAYVAASGAPQATFSQPAAPRCYCYEIVAWTPLQAAPVAEHEHCSAPAPSCH